MADQFPDEALDELLKIIPKGGGAPANVWIGLYTAGGGTSVPSSSQTLSQLAGAGNAGFAEVSTTQWSTYTRMTLAAGSWGASSASNVWSTTGKIVSGSQVSFTAPSGAYSPTAPGICGFFLATALTGGSAWYYSNFSDSSTIASLQANDVIKVTPSFGFGN